MKPRASNPVLPRIGRVVGRALVRRCARRLATLPAGFPPTVSFTFDDVPRSAVETALPILSAAGMTATWYAASELLDRPSACGVVMPAEWLAMLNRAGHEIGNHTCRHLDARAVPAEIYGEDIEENRRSLEAYLPGVNVESFSYPFGAVTVRAKRAAMRRAVTCRSTMAGLARGSVDLGLLPANPLYGEAGHLGMALDLIAELRRSGGWAIFYTHDVATHPSPWGCTPDLFRAVVAAAAEAGLRVAAVGSVADQILGRSP